MLQNQQGGGGCLIKRQASSISSPIVILNELSLNPCQSSPSLTILFPLWFTIISLVFSYLSKVLFSGFPQLKVILSIVKITHNTVTWFLFANRKINN